CWPLRSCPFIWATGRRDREDRQAEDELYTWQSHGDSALDACRASSNRKLHAASLLLLIDVRSQVANIEPNRTSHANAWHQPVLDQLPKAALANVQELGSFSVRKELVAIKPRLVHRLLSSR